MRILALVIALVSTTAAAQTPATPSCLDRTIAIGLMPRNTNAVPTLTNTTFRASLAGQPVQILSAQPGNGPRHFVLLVDTSGSMGRTGPVPSKMELALTLAADAVRRLPSTTSVALMFFGEREQTIGFHSTRDEILRSLNRDQRSAISAAHGKTLLLDAIVDAVHFIPSPQPGDVIYAITDGGDNRSATQEVDARRALVAAGVRLYAFVLEDPMPPTPEEHYGAVQMRQLAEATGGTAAVLPGRSISAVSTSYALDDETRVQVEKATRLLFSQITTPLLLQIRLPRAPEKLPASFLWDLISV